MGNSIRVPATTAASTGVQVGGSGVTGVRVHNGSTDVAFVTFGTSAVAAAVPVAGTPANGIPVGSSETEYFAMPSGAYISAISAIAGSSQAIYATPGQLGR